MPDQDITTSKFLSYVLRHKPESIGLALDSGGWASVEQLLELAAASGQNLSRSHLEKVVASNNKRRFTFSSDGSLIRAVQGHSIPVDLELDCIQPPDLLFHGTATRFLASIMKQGLLKQQRHHVHLSRDIETASAVGIRHGKLAILSVAAGLMHESGHHFYVSENGVWLVDHVPPQYLSREGPTPAAQVKSDREAS